MTIKGPAKSVYIVNDDDLRVNGGRWKLQSGKAIRVRGYTSDTLGDKKVYGGDALPVYVLGENDIRPNGGTWLLQDGEAVPVTSAIGSARGVIQGAAVPVYPVDDDGDFDSTFLTNLGTYAPKVLATQSGNLLAYWPMWESSGAISEDITGNGYDGAYTGVTLGQTGIGDGMTCPFYDGANDYNNVFSAALSAAFNGDAGTCLIWARVFNAGVWTDGNSRQFYEMYEGTFNNGIRIDVPALNNRYTSTYEAGGVVEQITRGTSTLDWFSAILTWDVNAGATGEVKLYHIGVQVGATRDTLGVWAIQPDRMIIGASSLAPAKVWHGYLAHCALWTVALTQAEVTNIATV